MDDPIRMIRNAADGRGTMDDRILVERSWLKAAVDEVDRARRENAYLSKVVQEAFLHGYDVAAGQTPYIHEVIKRRDEAWLGSAFLDILKERDR